MSMTKSEAIKEIRFNMSTIGLSNEAAKRVVEAREMAINALKKQIPKKPIEYEDKFYACPVCKNPVMHKWEKYNTELMEKSNGLPVCLNCLQAIDWSDEE